MAGQAPRAPFSLALTSMRPGSKAFLSFVHTPPVSWWAVSASRLSFTMPLSTSFPSRNAKQRSSFDCVSAQSAVPRSVLLHTAVSRTPESKFSSHTSFHSSFPAHDASAATANAATHTFFIRFLFSILFLINEVTGRKLREKSLTLQQRRSKKTKGHKHRAFLPLYPPPF